MDWLHWHRARQKNGILSGRKHDEKNELSTKIRDWKFQELVRVRWKEENMKRLKSSISLWRLQGEAILQPRMFAHSTQHCGIAMTNRHQQYRRVRPSPWNSSVGHGSHKPIAACVWTFACTFRLGRNNWWTWPEGRNTKTVSLKNLKRFRCSGYPVPVGISSSFGGEISLSRPSVFNTVSYFSP